MKTLIKAIIISFLIASFIGGCSSEYAATNGSKSHTKAGKKGFCMSQKMKGY